ncbi:MAG: ATP phosphoribosyltransferase [Pseudomonadales bacterium]|jgi:ATP phosphoribosyltransferase|nr:ATP phosphoribosyltransferase [Pseudomonadales bacterium]MDP6470858.1 ATP phosphoribosyltransferase [Pseudomonadales bacterium]MDP6825957.1 ATP phosphoribosyltransferase [Pseudomonadales bacterium]MDP6972269.1 ATP phosphoribosyltransferase [Pseudomonadales bacterium]
MGLTIALNRGRLLTEMLPMLDAIGMAPAEDMSTSRKLVFPTRDGAHQLIVMRGSDVPTYVEYGAADIGVVGKDTLMEYGSQAAYYERLDLGIGRCRLMTAARESDIRDGLLVNAQGVTRVASKYVRITRDYFARVGRQVVVIPLSGAMEIAPLMGLADCIVDIVDTGNTLKANGLVALETIAEVSARVIVNRASMKTRFDEVEGMIGRLKELVVR